MLHSSVRQLIHRVSQAIFGLRFRLLLLVLVAGTPLFALTVYTASRERRQEVQAWQDRSRRLTRLAHREERELVSETRQLLLAVSESSAVQPTNLAVCKRALEDVLASHPGYANLALADTNGAILTGVFPLARAGNQADRQFVRRVARTRSFGIRRYAGRFMPGRPAVRFGYPVFDSSDRVQAVVQASIPLDWYCRPGSGAAAQVPPGATWTVIDPNGAILARCPPPGPSGGHFFPDRSGITWAFSQPERILEVHNSAGVDVFRASSVMDSQLAAGQVVGILEIPKSLLFAEANQALRRNLSGLGLAAGLALVLGWVGSDLLVIRPVKGLVRASSRLASGDLSTRTGLRHGKDELGRLTRVFDEMAEALQQREIERQLAEETLQTRDTMIRELPLLPAAVCVCDQVGSLQLYNRTAVELWGCDPGDQPGSRRFCGSYQLFHPDGTPMPHNESPAAEVLRAGIPLRNRELLVGRPDGSRVPVLANVVPLRDAGGLIIGVVSCYQDISDRKRAEESLRESNDRLQLLSRRLVESQETERRHIARELHDEVGQTLTVAEMNLQAVVRSSRATTLTVRLKESLQAVERVLAQVRDLSLNLRPSMLDDLGLEPALRWYTGRQAAAAGLEADFQATASEQRLDPVIETACFRIAQEALTNVARHAHARSVTVELRQQEGFLHLFVRDDGAGFDVGGARERAALGSSLGLLNMEERATLAGGSLEFKSAQGQGTEVHAWFPLKWRAANS
jgi:PAS domain S-box-containing protein